MSNFGKIPVRKEGVLESSNIRSQTFEERLDFGHFSEQIS